MIDYVSSRNIKNVVTAHQAVIEGLASDGGLFTPINIEEKLAVSDLLDKSYQEIALKVVGLFLNSYSEEELLDCIEKAYDDKFDSKEIVPLREVSNFYLMELWHGPTGAFKDIALTLLPQLLTTAYKKEKREDIISILTATSGDTGKAALAGFADVENTAITVFYPEIGVSPIQKKQMQTAIGENVEVIAVKGNFDDCQRMVKEAYESELVKNACKSVSLSSANSINIGRLVAQITYYYSTYVKLVNEGKISCGEKVNFVVPTGNFGDILAGYFASKVGLPIGKLICASNSNKVLTDFLETGVYSVNRDFYTTMSPSMDILISSNLERLLFIESGYDDELIKSLMNDLKEKGEFKVNEEIMNKIRSNFIGYWASEKDCGKTMKDLYYENGCLIDPHTSVAVTALKKYQEDSGDQTVAVVLSTATPYKFPKDVLKSVFEIEVDNDFEAMKKLEELSKVVAPSYLKELENKEVRFNKTIEINEGMEVIAERMAHLSYVEN